MSRCDSVLKASNLQHFKFQPESVPCVRKVVFILREHFSMAALSVAMDALLTTNLMSAAPLFSICLAAQQARVTSDLGMAVDVDVRTEALQLHGGDIVMVCGGLRVRLEAEAALRKKLLEADRLGCTLGGLWNGAYFLAEAGLLEHFDCAFHPDGRAMMRELFPGVGVTRYAHVLDRQRATCAGVSSALAMTLDLLERLAGWPLRRSVEQLLACDRDSGLAGAPTCVKDVPPSLPGMLRVALELMHANVEDPLAITDIARHAKVSRRQMQRLFERYMEATPTRYYMELRLTHARQLLQHTDKSMGEVAVACGFVSFPHFSKRFREMFAIAPRHFRARSQGRLEIAEAGSAGQ